VYRSLEISTRNNHIYIKKNKAEKITILILSIVSESFLGYILFKNISLAKDPNIIKHAITLLFLITLIFVVLLFLSLRKFFMDTDFDIEIAGERVLVNGFEKFKKTKIDIIVDDNVNRWGTKTYNISLKGDSQSIIIVLGVDEVDKENLVKNLKTIFLGSTTS
jgi:hypothetical protein